MIWLAMVGKCSLYCTCDLVMDVYDEPDGLDA